MATLDGKKVVILATNGYEQSELVEPLKQLRKAGASVDIVSLEMGDIRGWQGKDWGDAVPVDKTIEDAHVGDYDSLVLPGGQINPDILRTNTAAVDFVRAFFDSGKPMGAICHAPWMLIEADVMRGVKATSYHSIRTDMINAGALWTDQEVVTDRGLVTSRKPDDLPAFCAKLIEEIAEGRHNQRKAA